MSRLTRREFIVSAGAAGALAAFAGCGSKKTAGPATPAKHPKPTSSAPSNLVVASSGSPAKKVAAAVAALGGMSAFVKRGNRVVVKPNAAWARPAGAAATTSPEVVAAIVKLCKDAGASQVIVVDHLIDRPSDMVLQLTGIGPAAKAAGAKVVSASNQNMYHPVEIPDCEILIEEQVIKDILDADVFINVPVAKCHSDTQVSLGLKNLMGVIWSRQPWHTSASVHQCVAEFSTAVRPHLTVLDANRILLTNGPKGPGDTKDVGQIIAGVDPVAVDAYGATLFGLRPSEVDHIRLAHELGSGEIDLTRVTIAKV